MADGFTRLPSAWSVTSSGRATAFRLTAGDHNSRTVTSHWVQQLVDSKSELLLVLGKLYLDLR